MSGEAALIWCPFPGPQSAREAIATLLDERLVACGNVFEEVPSLFSWQGKRNESVESGVLFKTTAVRLEGALERLRELHPYDTPAIIGWTAHTGPDTLAWLEEETQPE